MIKIFHFDDNRSARNDVETYIIAINEDYQEKNVHLKIHLESFERADLLREKLLTVKREQNDTPQIIILDMYENNVDIGEGVLKMLKELKLNINTIIFTQGSIDGNVIYYERLLTEYPFIIGEEINKGHPEKLKDRIKEIIENKNPSNEKLFDVDKNDILLEAQIQLIGEQNLNKILHKAREHFRYYQKFNIERMFSGRSGAIVFKLKHDNKTHILKISNNIEKLKNEYEKYKHYKDFPSIFRISIEKDFETQQSYAFLTEFVHTAVPLFEWLQNNMDKDNVGIYFERLYLNENALAKFYANNSEVNGEKVKFEQIFEISRDNYALIATSIKELKPLTDKYNPNFKESNIKNLVLHGIYDRIDKSELIGDNYKKHKILCHGDFHSNNIMVQGDKANSPIIIDIGSIKYDYWCVDICRLIVHLFIVGFDKENLKYFDISEISSNLETAKKIITLEEELRTDGSNDGYIHAINWLKNNVQKIYGDLYCTWEFQLGLCREFLRMSYKADSIPPNKRTIALLSAYECMLQANNNIK